MLYKSLTRYCRCLNVLDFSSDSFLEIHCHFRGVGVAKTELEEGFGQMFEDVWQNREDSGHLWTFKPATPGSNFWISDDVKTLFDSWAFSRYLASHTPNFLCNEDPMVAKLAEDCEHLMRVPLGQRSQLEENWTKWTKLHWRATTVPHTCQILMSVSQGDGSQVLVWFHSEWHSNCKSDNWAW